MTDEFVKILLALISGGVVSGIITSLVNRRAQQRNLEAQANVTEQEAETRRAGLFEKPFAQAAAFLETLRIENDRLRARVDDMWKEINELKEGLPERILSARLENEDTRLVLDKSGLCAIQSLPIESGRFIWVSEGLASLLGMSKDQLILTDWKTLVHPDDLDRTLAAESAAHGRTVEVQNRYRRSDGTYIDLRWISTRYRPTAFAVAIPLRRTVDILKENEGNARANG